MTQYIVKNGDSLSKIALSVYGTFSSIGTWDPVKELAKANNITNVDVIYPGMPLIIPDKPSTPVPADPSSSSSNAGWWFLGSILAGIGGYFVYKKIKEHKEKAKASA
ncbi:hypothetical protein WSM22_02860 [Cytophagales bacterium WSM2-2]|nr:hypothetical protein WSM22_02860 [Cytophagales bacterium WSM2-2]